MYYLPSEDGKGLMKSIPQRLNIIHAYMHTHVHHIGIHAYVHMNTCMHVSIYVCINTCVEVYMMGPKAKKFL